MSTIRDNKRWLLAPVLVLMLAALTLGGRPRKPKELPAPPGGELPTDLNRASLRVVAVDTLYQLDLSPQQLQAMRTAAEGAASNAERSQAKGNPKLITALDDLNRALLESKDDQQIAKLRNALSDASTADDVHLDDEVHPTPVALKKAGGIARQFTAGQIAAFLASHADEVVDPVDKMVGALPVLHDAGSAVEADTQDVAEDTAHLAVGMTDPRAVPLSAKVVAWLKANRDLSDEEIVTRHAALEDSARKVIGEVAPMDVLSHWMDHQAAVLLSNPELPEAIGAVLAAKERG